MKRVSSLILVFALVGKVFWNAALLAAELAATSEGPRQSIDFRRDIEPIFAERCYSCHGPEKQKNGLRLDRKKFASEGGDSGPAFVPGKSQESRLYKYVAGLDPKIVMPQKGERLTTNQVALIKAWIDTGAPWPQEEFALTEPATRNTNHWSFKPTQRPAIPNVKNAGWVRNPIDAFISKEHETRGLKPSPKAPRRSLLRRLSLDLTGLPPSLEEIEAFLNDSSLDAYTELVERLLASPRYGERWGRHWLDLARWAETDSYEANAFRPAAWRYRDYVIQSFNYDKPYNQFLREQIAGDELSPYSDENLIATGFLAAARLNTNEEDKSIQRNEPLIDIANAVANVTLGLTLNCAQCHDHKFDPFTIRDYYRFQGFFINGQMNNLLLKDPEMWKVYEASIPPELETAKKLRAQLYEPARARLVEEAQKRLSPESRAALNTPADKRTPEQVDLAKRAEKELIIPKDKVEKSLTEDDQKLFKELEKKISSIEKQLDERKPQTWAFYSPATSPHKVDALPPRGMYPLPYEPQKLKEARAHLLKRGDVHRPGEELESDVPQVLGSARDSRASVGDSPTETLRFESRFPKAPAEAGTPSRTALVDWLTDTNCTLTARVWANYVWQQHFGRGIVATSGDFGTQGTKPTHAELLDWLASELLRSGWSTKHLHRLILLSNTYRQASQPDPENEKIDPDNHFLWRWSPRRLEAEAIRDSVLLVSGELDPAIGGDSSPPETENKKLRRALYLRQKRHEFPVMQALFDSPTANESCPRRHISTVSLQPLYLLNSEFMMKRAETFAARVWDKAGTEQSKQIEIAFALALARTPDTRELEAARALFAENQTSKPPQSSEQTATGTNHIQGPALKSPPSALIQFCHALLNLNEFVYLE